MKVKPSCSLLGKELLKEEIIMNQTHRSLAKSRGFTLIELLVVVAILATMAGIAVSAVGGYEQKARADLAQTEIKRIANAVLAFKEDTGYFPNTGVFSSDDANSHAASDFAFLFYSPRYESQTDDKGGEILSWDGASSRGWNGPYLSFDSLNYMRKGGCHNAAYEDAMSVFPSNVNRQTDANTVVGLADPFEARANYSAETELCFVTHRERDNALIAKPFASQPYHYELAFKNDRYPDCNAQGSGCIALLSAGQNGQFENGDNDDIVRILRVN